MSLARHDCPSCGAAVRFHGVTDIVCDFCGTHLSRPARTRTKVSWTQQESISATDRGEFEGLLASFEEEDHLPDTREDYERACRLVALAPTQGIGYYHRAHARFWVSITSKSTFEDFFSCLRPINDDIEECDRWCSDPEIANELRQVIFSNMAEIAVHQADRGLTGARIENIMKMLLVCSSKLPNSASVAGNMQKFGAMVVDFAITELERAKRQTGQGFAPPPTHLEYLFYSWKYLGFTGGLKAYAEYVQLFLKNSNDNATKTGLRENIKELEAEGLIKAAPTKSLFGLGKKGWFS